MSWTNTWTLGFSILVAVVISALSGFTLSVMVAALIALPLSLIFQHNLFQGEELLFMIPLIALFVVPFVVGHTIHSGRYLNSK